MYFFLFGRPGHGSPVWESRQTRRCLSKASIPLVPICTPCTSAHSSIPLMLMNYVGALKSWLYPRILHSFGANVITLRIPMVLAGAISIWLFFLLLRRIAGERAALVGCTLLAVDSAYLLSLCFDWGPVALQHLLLIGGMLSVVKFYQDKKTVGPGGRLLSVRPRTLGQSAGGLDALRAGPGRDPGLSTAAVFAPRPAACRHRGAGLRAGRLPAAGVQRGASLGHFRRQLSPRHQ